MTRNVNLFKFIALVCLPAGMLLGLGKSWPGSALNEGGATGAILVYLPWLGNSDVITGCVDPPANLVAWWPGDAEFGSAAHDLVGGHHGTFRLGAAYDPVGMVAEAFSFDGVDDYIEVPGGGDLEIDEEDFSMDAWLKIDPSEAGTGENLILEKFLYKVGEYFGYRLFITQGKPGIQLADGTGNLMYEKYITTSSIADGAWHFLAVTVDGDGVSRQIVFYVDGNPEAQFSSPFAGSLRNNHPMWIGGNSMVGSDNLQGSIDELEFAKKVLTPEEIQAIYTAGHYGKCKPEPAPDL